MRHVSAGKGICLQSEKLGLILWTYMLKGVNLLLQVVSCMCVRAIAYQYKQTHTNNLLSWCSVTCMHIFCTERFTIYRQLVCFSWRKKIFLPLNIPQVPDYVLVVTDSSFIGVKTSSTRERSFLVVKPRQLLGVSEVMYMGGDHTTISLLHQCNS